jgi:molybdopterin molybdotransferase
MIELEDALPQILASIPAPLSERIRLNDAHERILAETVSSPLDLPVFDNSAMDGYAVRSADVTSAQPEAPARLHLRGRIAAGETFAGELAGGECIRLFTGSPLPHGADAVVMQEETRIDADQPAHILILGPAQPRENVRRRGEDVKRGTVLAEAGEVLTTGKIGLLAATGVTEVGVGTRPTVGLLATGSELREPGHPLAPGQIYESNRIGLATLAGRAGAVPKLFPLVPDTLAATQAALERAFSDCDCVVTSGGVSVGEMDFVKTAFVRLGGQLQFWKVAIRPGRPFVFGDCGGKFLFGLPGNPVSALVTFLLLVRPALLRWQGARDVALPAHPGVLAEPLANPGERRHFMRVRVDAAGKVFLAGLQESHALGSMAAANGLVDVPVKTTLAAGTTIPVMRWNW